MFRTKKQFFEAIKGLGNITARYDSDLKEYRVNLRGGKEATAYYTDNRDDALDTARAMSKAGKPC